MSIIPEDYDVIDCAMISASMSRILYHDLDSAKPEGRKALSQQLETGFDRLLGGAYLLSQHSAKIITKLGVRYEDGVFAYDHLESSSDPSKDMTRFINNERTSISLPAFIYGKMTHADWYQISENHQPPVALEGWVKEWLELAKLETESAE